MDTLPPGDVFMVDGFFTSSLDPMCNSAVPRRLDTDIAPLGLELRPANHLKPDALVALFDSPFPSIFRTSGNVDDIYAFDYTQNTCNPHDFRMNKGMPDAQMLEIPTVGWISDVSEWHEPGHISPSQLSPTFELGSSVPESEFFRSYFIPGRSESQSEFPAAQVLEMKDSDICRRASQDSVRSSSGARSTSSENCSKVGDRQARPVENGSTKPRRKRGRKRSNLNPEERRARRLECGRLAANKCRKKKREMEYELESKASNLLVERDRMLKINDSLKDQIRELQAEILRHTGPDCKGMPDGTPKAPPVHASEPPPKAFLDTNQSQVLPCSERQQFCGPFEMAGGLLHITAQVQAHGTPVYANADLRNVEIRSAEEIVRAVLGAGGSAR